jgi:hypothetical protein
MSTVNPANGVISSTSDEVIRIADSGNYCVFSVRGLSGGSLTVQAAPRGAGYDEVHAYTASNAVNGNSLQSITFDGLYRVYCSELDIWLERNQGSGIIYIAPRTYA